MPLDDRHDQPLTTIAAPIARRDISPFEVTRAFLAGVGDKDLDITRVGMRTIFANVMNRLRLSGLAARCGRGGGRLIGPGARS